MKLIKLTLVLLALQYASPFCFGGIRSYLTGTTSVPKNFAIAITDSCWTLGVFSESGRQTIKLSLPSGDIVEYLPGWLATMTKWELRQWYMEDIISGSETDAYYVRSTPLIMETREYLPLAPPLGTRWMFILKKIPTQELVDTVENISVVEQFMLANMYYHLNFDATGACCLYWPNGIPISPTEQYISFASTNTVDDLKAIAAVYTPENGGENIPAGDIATLENALETDFGRSVLAELLQLHGDPREE